MTPKEKAKELYNKYFSMIKIESPIDRVSSIPYVKKCALIAVDEILKAQPSEKGMIIGGTQTRHLTIDYWEKVKQEINNL